MNYIPEVNSFMNTVISQFTNRTSVEERKERNGEKKFKNAVMTGKIENKLIWFTISLSGEAYHITVPVPFVENNIMFIECNSVKRAVCNFFEVATDTEIAYIDAMQRIFVGDPTGITAVYLASKVGNKSNKKTNSSNVQELAWAVANENLPIKIYRLQKLINEVVNGMPLHETMMNSFVMNRKLTLIDINFDTISNPKDQLDYQVGKNEHYFSRGWTSIGLSDGTLVNKNYILTEDLRKYTPFGLHHHNPQRNLYSTLGMKGDELPLITSKSGKTLIDSGIERTGWNLFTVYVDVPGTYEDQILVDTAHRDKLTKKKRRFQCFGKIIVKVGDKLKYNQAIAELDSGDSEKYDIVSDSAEVKEINKVILSVGNVEVEAHNVVIETTRYAVDATKFTNQHGNKGVIHFINELGYAIDPGTGELRRIDVIVSAKTIKKRKNFGQVLEVVYNNLNERNGVLFGEVAPYLTKSTTTVLGKEVTFYDYRGLQTEVIETATASNRSIWCKDKVGLSPRIDVIKRKKITMNRLTPFTVDDEISLGDGGIDSMKNDLVSVGIPRNGSWVCNTFYGEVTGVSGPMFWGIIKDPEDQLWDKHDVMGVNGKGVRTGGLKFSTVEFKALTTRFGKNNPIIDEILSYAQGTENIEEIIKILKSKKFEFEGGLPVVAVNDIKTVDQNNGTIFESDAIQGTLCDEEFYPDGFVLELPITFQTAVAIKPTETHEGAPFITEDTVDWDVYKNVYNTNRIYVPSGKLRKSWLHGTGMLGLSDLSTLLNNIVIFSHKHADPNQTPEEFNRNLGILYKTVQAYFTRAANTLCTKKGYISNYGLSVRYPFSGKGSASLSNDLPPNTVEIHRDMANILKVEHGDIGIVERFPCLGFMGIRPQQIFITDDPMCKYTIRSSNESLTSTNLDFDGDNVYVAAFHSEAAKMALRAEWEHPTKECWEMIDKLNQRKGKPSIACLDIDNFEIATFDSLTVEEHSAIVRKLTGVKAQTGPVIALAYNLMRLIENCGLNIDKRTEVGIEMFIEKAGQSVFEQKHGGESLCEIVLEAICTGDDKMLIDEGFDPYISTMICDVIRTKAAARGINCLKSFHKDVGSKGSNIISRVVKEEHKLYFASRSSMEGCLLLEHLDNDSIVDIPSYIFRKIISGSCDKSMNLLLSKEV